MLLSVQYNKDEVCKKQDLRLRRMCLTAAILGKFVGYFVKRVDMVTVH